MGISQGWSRRILHGRAACRNAEILGTTSRVDTGAEFEAFNCTIIFNFNCALKLNTQTIIVSLMCPFAQKYGNGNAPGSSDGVHDERGIL